MPVSLDLVPDLKNTLHDHLRQSRATLVDRLDGLGEYDLRRPMTPTGTNLLGLVKHLAGLEYGYLGESFGRPAPERLAWFDDGSVWDGADMWALPEESSDYLRGLYERACAHADTTIETFDLDAPGRVAHWPPEQAATTLGVLLVRMVGETAQHAGHADIVRELVDGRTGSNTGDVDAASWASYLARVQAAADAFKDTHGH